MEDCILLENYQHFEQRFHKISLYPIAKLNLPYGNLFNKMTTLGKDLHSRSFISTITYHKFATVSHDGDLTRIPKLTLLSSS